MALYAFDGTMDDDRGAGTDAAAVAASTNVWKTYAAYKANSETAGIQSLYEPGVGTRFGPVGAVVGAAFGAGWLDRINGTHAALCRNYLAGDTVIDVVGFSRGSAIALDFVNKVHADGIRRNGSVVVPRPAIRFVGLFDVVAAFGVANLGGPLADFVPLHHLTLPSSVQQAFHAMSLDERRPSFEVTRVKGAYEVWFRGVHSDIGGGNGNPGLNNITLRWMWKKAIACGLPITAANLNAGHDGCRPTDPIKPNFFSEINKLTWRNVRPSDWVHYTVPEHVVLPGEDCNAVPSTCLVETPAFEESRVRLP